MTAKEVGKGEKPRRDQTPLGVMKRVTIPIAVLLLVGLTVPGGSIAATPQAATVHARASCNGNSTCNLDSTLDNIQYFLIGVGLPITGTTHTPLRIVSSDAEHEVITTNPEELRTCMTTEA